MNVHPASLFTYRKPGFMIGSLALIVGTILLFGSLVTAQESGGGRVAGPPANDLPANATVITFPYDASTDPLVTDLSQAASASEAVPTCNAGAGYSVWFKFTIAAAGKVTLDTRLSTFFSDDTTLSLYSPGTTAGNEIACNDDFDINTEFAALVDQPVTAGTYYVQISNGFPEDTDSGDILRFQASFVLDPTNTPTPTNTSTVTNTPTLTLTPSITPTPNDPELTATAGGDTLTPTSTATETQTPTATATATETTVPVIELLLNGGMENDTDTDKIPDNWKGKKLSSDVQKCNTETKIIARTGECAFKFKGGIGEKSKLYQDVDLTAFTFAQGDVLNLAVYTLAKKPTSKIKVKVQAQYSDSAEKTTFAEAALTGVDYLLTDGSITLLSGNLTRLRVQISHKSLSGKVYVDDVSLSMSAARSGNLLPLP